MPILAATINYLDQIILISAIDVAPIQGAATVCPAVSCQS